MSWQQLALIVVVCACMSRSVERIGAKEDALPIAPVGYVVVKTIDHGGTTSFLVLPVSKAFNAPEIFAKQKQALGKYKELQKQYAVDKKTFKADKANKGERFSVPRPKRPSVRVVSIMMATLEDATAALATVKEKEAQQAAKKRAKKGPLLRTKYGKVMIFPGNNPWNRDISKLKVHPKSKQYIASIGSGTFLKMDVSRRPEHGIPYTVVNRKQKRVPVVFKYVDESDPGPYPIPDDAAIEGGSASSADRHVIVLDVHAKKLYELFHAYKTQKGWKAVSGAIFDLTSNKLRPKGWTSADAAGLPIFPGLLQYQEVERGEVRHALRFTIKKAGAGWISPARHSSGSDSAANRPRMGTRFRLKKSFRTKGFPKRARVILRGLKKYGLIVADKGSDWYIQGVSHPDWDMASLRAISQVRGKDFEAVYTGKIQTK